MSLRRILNDEPSSPLTGPPPPQSGHAHLTPVDPQPPLRSPSPSSTSSIHNGHRRQRGRSRSPPLDPELHHSRAMHFQPVAYQGSTGWDHYNGQWGQGEVYQGAPGGNHYYPESEDGTPPSPHMTNGGAGKYKEVYADGGGRRKRKAAVSVDEEEEYPPQAPRRVCTPIHFWWHIKLTSLYS